MPDSIDDVKILPKLSSNDVKDQVFQVVWVLDFDIENTLCYVNVLFKNVKTEQFVCDTIPPELLRYCTVGSFFKNGKKIKENPDWKSLSINITSSSNNNISVAHNVISKHEYDLSFSDKNDIYYRACNLQFCFSNNISNMKVVIPCFVIAATYYFRSTSLRDAILSRNIGSLFHECKLVENSTHAFIYLKPGANFCDVYSIARFKLDDFAKDHLYMCHHHLYSDKHNKYSRLKVDFPVKQENLPLKARGHLIDNNDGTKTFIVFQIESENSRFPFDSIEIQYEENESTSSASTDKFPSMITKHSNALVNRSPANSILRTLLESCPPPENQYAKRIKETRTPIPKSHSINQKAIDPIFDGSTTDLSSQPSTPNEDSVSKADIKEKEDSPLKEKKIFNLDKFKEIVSPLSNYIYDNNGVSIHITGYAYFEAAVSRRKGAKNISKKASYTDSYFDPRNYAYVRFNLLDRHICLVELDQKYLPGSGCSTFVLISQDDILDEHAKLCIDGYIANKNLKQRSTEMTKKNIIMDTKNHPSSHDDESFESWRVRLIANILDLIKRSSSK